MLNKEIVLKNLKDFRYNHIDDLPKEKVTMEDKNYYKYKCRWNFMIWVKDHISWLISKNLLNEESSIKKGNEFVNYIMERDFERKTTKEEINMVNDILDKVIKDLEIKKKN